MRDVVRVPCATVPLAAGLALAAVPTPPEASTSAPRCVLMHARPDALRPEAYWRPRSRTRARATDQQSVGGVAAVRARPDAL
jgi:hypothetical protein